MSLLRAFNGETYTTCVSSTSFPSTAFQTRSSIAERKAESVLPEPVGAAISVCSPRLMAGQARACGSVGAENLFRNQSRTAGWKYSSSFINDSQCTTNETLC